MTVQCLLLHTLSTGHWETAQALWDVFLFHYFLGEIFSMLILIGRGEVGSCSWVAAFCFAFVSKQMHSCHSRSHWRLLSNVIASKLIPMDARLQIQLFQVSVKRMLQRGMQQKLQIYEFKYRRGHRHYDSHQALLKQHNTFGFIVFSAVLLPLLKTVALV